MNCVIGSLFLFAYAARKVRAIYIFLYVNLPCHWFLFCFLFLLLCFFSLQMHRMHDLFIIGSGEAMLQLIPPAQCRRHCQSVAMPLESGDVGRWGPQGARSVTGSL